MVVQAPSCLGRWVIIPIHKLPHTAAIQACPLGNPLSQLTGSKSLVPLSVNIANSEFRAKFLQTNSQQERQVVLAGGSSSGSLPLALEGEVLVQAFSLSSAKIPDIMWKQTGLRDPV